MRGHTPRKRFGQNFLVDRTIIGRIVAAIAPRQEDRLIEIGPGMAALTGPLLERVAHLHVIEIDRDLAAALAREFPAERMTIHVGDALEFDFASLGSGVRVVGNLPYNVSTPLLFHIARHADRLTDLHVMLQREVVERMVAAPGSAEYGRLSVMLGYRFRIERVLRVPAGAFRPVPKVESAFVRLVPHAPLSWPADDEATFAAVVAAAFGQRRKTLRNALGQLASAAMLEELGIDPGLRAERLSIEAFVRIANAVACARLPAGESVRPAASSG